MAESLFIHIPGVNGPPACADRFVNALDRALRTRGKLGQCVDGVATLDLNSEITQCDIEVEVKDLAKALPVIRDALADEQAPPGTTVAHPDTDKVLLRFINSGVRVSAPPILRPKQKGFVDPCPWEPGEVLAYRIRHERYVLLHAYGSDGFGPLFWVPEWCGPKIPADEKIRRLVRKKQEFWRLGYVFRAWQTREGDRDDRRLIRTGVVIPPPAGGVRGWVPGMVEVRPWKVFERMLKEVFGLVPVSGTMRLHYDLGLLTGIANLAVWHPAGAVTKKDARRLFYDHVTTFRRPSPGRKRQRVTDELKDFVTELKERFEADDVWANTFSASEGFVIIAVKPKKFAGVWAEATRLARRHGLACYDPVAHQLCRREL
jgi:hypothetical protein